MSYLIRQSVNARQRWQQQNSVASTPEARLALAMIRRAIWDVVEPPGDNSERLRNDALRFFQGPFYASLCLVLVGTVCLPPAVEKWAADNGVTIL